MKTALIVAAAMVLGAGVGYSQVLCPGGYCAMTGSWYGGAMLGGVVGLFALQSRRVDPNDQASAPEKTKDEG